jgi:predicted phage terminase large subunit-like protein
MKWDVVYEQAIRPDGSLLFPQKLSKEKLDELKRELGSYKFTNQYLNRVIPDELRKFKPEWWRISPGPPPGMPTNTFAFLDPAIGQEEQHDYTALVVVSVDANTNWYVRVAQRYRLTPTEIVSKIFEVHQKIKPMVIGYESQVFQESIEYFVREESKRRLTLPPLVGIKRGKQTKEARIEGLVPRFEFGRIYMMEDFEHLKSEYDDFPRAAHDDLMDALASIEDIVQYPEIGAVPQTPRPHSPHNANYEKWAIEQLIKKRNSENLDEYD